MGFFPETIRAHLAKREVGAAVLVFMDFRETPRRWWGGFGTLNAGGHDWLGTGEVVSIDGLDQPLGVTAPRATFRLSGVDPTIVAMAQEASDKVKDRRVTVYLQCFDVQTHALLDNPFAIWSGRMDQISYTASGPSERTVTLSAESLWVNRNRPPFGLYTDREQNARFPGDTGLRHVASLVNKTIKWP